MKEKEDARIAKRLQREKDEEEMMKVEFSKRREFLKNRKGSSMSLNDDDDKNRPVSDSDSDSDDDKKDNIGGRKRKPGLPRASKGKKDDKNKPTRQLDCVYNVYLQDDTNADSALF